MNGRSTALACILALAACGGGTSVTPSPTPTPTQPPGISALAYPLPGSTAVPATVGVILIADWDSAPASSFSVEAHGGGQVTVTPTAVPSPLPSGVPSGPPYLALAIPNLSPATQYGVAEAPCSPAQPPACTAIINLGSFTTR